MAKDTGFITHLLDLLESYENVTARAMFGGHGIYRDGRMFGLVDGGVLYLKVDAENRATFEEAGLEPFRYEMKDGRVSVMSYHRCPEEALESPARMRPWAESAMAAAARAPLPRPKRPRKKASDL